MFLKNWKFLFSFAFIYNKIITDKNTLELTSDCIETNENGKALVYSWKHTIKCLNTNAESLVKIRQWRKQKRFLSYANASEQLNLNGSTGWKRQTFYFSICFDCDICSKSISNFAIKTSIIKDFENSSNHTSALSKAVFVQYVVCQPYLSDYLFHHKKAIHICVSCNKEKVQTSLKWMASPIWNWWRTIGLMKWLIEMPKNSKHTSISLFFSLFRHNTLYIETIWKEVRFFLCLPGLARPVLPKANLFLFQSQKSLQFSLICLRFVSIHVFSPQIYLIYLIYHLVCPQASI